MLSNQEIEEMSAELISIYAEIENDLLQNVANRFSVLEEVYPDTITAWQTEKLMQLGAITKENTKILAKKSGKTQKEIETILSKAGYKALDLDELIYKEAYSQGLLAQLPVPAKLSPILSQVIGGAIANTREYMNMINTTALESAKEGFLNIINQTYLEVSTGISTHQQAVRKAVRSLADKGITGATYMSDAGRLTRNHIDVAVRRAIVTSTSQTAGTMQIKRAEEWGSNLVEVTSHIGSRPSHAVWQGRIFSLKGSTQKYPNLVAVTDYGSVTGLKGANCSHDFYPFFEGISEQTYKPYNLNENEKVYKESQQQRKLEREIRQQKRRILAADATGDSAMKAKSQLALKAKESQLKDFVNRTGRTQRTDRQQVAGFGQSEAMKAVWAKKKSQIPGGSSGTTLPSKYSNLQAEKYYPTSLAGVKPGKPMTFDEADNGRANPKYNLAGGYRINCQSCVVSHEARLRGYDVETLPNTRGSKLYELSGATNKAWIDPVTGTFPGYIIDDTVSTPKQCLSWLESIIEPENRYTFQFGWKGRGRSGHIVTISRNESGIIMIYDPQVNQQYSGSALLNYLKQLKYTTSVYGMKIPTPPKVLRVDDKYFNVDMVNHIMKGTD